MYAQGMSFRATANYVTTPAGEDVEITNMANYPRVSAQGNTVGWLRPATTRNRSAAVPDPRLAGIAFVANNALVTPRYRMDVPEGNYLLRVALGDATSGQHTQTMRLFDGEQEIALLGGIDGQGTPVGNQYRDAEFTLFTTPEEWVSGNQQLPLTITSGSFEFELGGGIGRASSTIAYLLLEQVPEPVLPSVVRTQSGQVTLHRKAA